MNVDERERLIRLSAEKIENCGGFFKEGSIYLVNSDFINKNTFTLHTVKPPSIWSDNRFISLKDESISFELSAGEAVLLKF